MDMANRAGFKMTEGIVKGWADAPNSPKPIKQYDSTEWAEKKPNGWLGKYSDNRLGVKYVRKDGKAVVFVTELKAIEAAKFSRLRELSPKEPIRGERVAPSLRSTKTIVIQSSNFKSGVRRGYK
jgi:hypothetical protein